MSSTESIVIQLETNGYTHRGDVVDFGDFQLRFAAVLTGPGAGAGLVCLEDASASMSQDLVRRTRSLLLGLESIGSRRHVALIFRGSLEEDTRIRLASMVRLLWVPDAASESAVAAVLQPLLPMELPDPRPLDGMAIQEVRARAEAAPDDDVEALLQSAASGSEAVRTMFIGQIEQLSRADHEPIS